ncbi:MAG: winged helix-turn-helix domain-containing protein [Acidobacteria bacterium]|nr:winged helix-turn-helix domain-containing protein [Acidobacteriota bacterium]
MSSEVQVAAPLRFGAFEVDARAGELRKNGHRIKLQEQPFHVLLLLLQHPGQVVTREELRRELWPADTFVDYENSLNTAINKIREALGDSAEEPHYVETLPRRGYRFIASVEGSGGTSSQAGHAVPRRRNQLLAVSLTLAAFLLAGYFAWKRPPPPTPVASPNVSGRVMLAVLPFQNLSGDPEQEYFSDGMSEELITQLGKLNAERLAVIARTSTMPYKQTKKSVAEIGKELGVAYVLEGSVRREEERVRVSAQLIRAGDQAQVWTESYERESADILTLQSDLALAIAEAAVIKLTPMERALFAGRRPVNAAALEAYLKGRFEGKRLSTEESLQRRISYFEQALRIDANFAPAWAGLADAYATMTDEGYLRPNAGLPKMRSAATKAVELDHTLAEAHMVMATVREAEWDWAGAEKEYLRAIALDSSMARAHQWYSNLLAALKRDEEALQQARLAAELHGSRPLYLAFTLVNQRRYEEAIRQARRVPPSSDRRWGAKVIVARALLLNGQPEAALAELRQVEKEDPGLLPREVLVHAYAAGGRRREAILEFRKMEEEAARNYMPPEFLALASVGLGDNEAAIRWLAKAYDEHSFRIMEVMPLPEFDPLRSDPRFQDLMKRLGLPQ